MGENKFIICNHCKRFINDKNDLVVAYDFLVMNAYHSECFARRAKENFFLSKKPVNGLVSNIVTVLFGIAGLSGLFTDFYVFTVMAILQLSIRLYSWLKYESILED